MRKNTSPWLHQLDVERVPYILSQDSAADVVIVGAGIAGIATAFEILTTTKKSLLILERSRLAHGATGHNAGQVVGHFERGLKSLVDEFGLAPAIAGQQAIEGAWETLHHMYTTAGLDIPFFEFVGHTGFTSEAQVLLRLENNRLRVLGGLEPELLEIADSAKFAAHIPVQYSGLYSLVPLATIKHLLETERDDFVAVLSYRKGCINSALFCEEMVRFFVRRYQDRCTLFEHTPAHKIILRHDSALIDSGEHTITAGRIVLCTNGFENVRIFNETGLDIDAKYHYLVTGKRAYMSGYLEHLNKDPIAISYFTDPSIDPDNSYYYLTRRPFEYEKGRTHNLICIGGPDVSLEDTTPYSRDEEYPEEFAEEIDRFVKSTYDLDPNKHIDYIFTWHGLMGYTKNGVRMIGPEPKNPVLLYNLGCNGIGILPSLFGATKIARHLRGEAVEPSIFDIPTSVSALQKPHSRGIVADFFEWLRTRD